MVAPDDVQILLVFLLGLFDAGDLSLLLDGLPLTEKGTFRIEVIENHRVTRFRAVLDPHELHRVESRDVIAGAGQEANEMDWIVSFEVKRLISDALPGVIKGGCFCLVKQKARNRRVGLAEGHIYVAAFLPAVGVTDFERKPHRAFRGRLTLQLGNERDGVIRLGGGGLTQKDSLVKRPHVFRCLCLGAVRENIRIESFEEHVLGSGNVSPGHFPCDFLLARKIAG